MGPRSPFGPSERVPLFMSTGTRPSPADPESVFAWAAPPVVFGRGAIDETGAHVAALGVHNVALVTDGGIVADRARGTRDGRADRRRPRCRGLRPRPRRADGRLAQGGGRLGAGAPDRRVRRPRRRLGDRHRQGDEPALDERRRAGGLPQRAGRACPGPDAPADAADRDPDHRRHGRREHAGLRRRCPAAPPQDRHQPPVAAAAPRDRGPRDHAHDAARS